VLFWIYVRGLHASEASLGRVAAPYFESCVGGIAVDTNHDHECGGWCLMRRWSFAVSVGIWIYGRG